MDSYENSYFLPQRIHDLWLLYGGLPMADSNWRPRRYPLTLDHPYYQQDRVKMFLNAQSWIDFLKGIPGVDDADPMTFPYSEHQKFLRKDKPVKPIKAEVELSNSNTRIGNQIKLPKVVGNKNDEMDE